MVHVDGVGAVLCCGVLGCVCGFDVLFHYVGVRDGVAALLIGDAPVAPVAALFLMVCWMWLVCGAAFVLPLCCVASGFVALYLVPVCGVVNVGMPIVLDMAWNSSSVVSVVVTLMKWE